VLADRSSQAKAEAPSVASSARTLSRRVRRRGAGEGGRFRVSAERSAGAALMVDCEGVQVGFAWGGDV
jgi:hypothetical protein